MSLAIRRLLAPEFLGWLKSMLRQGNHYRGDHPDWDTARLASNGYEAADILMRVRDAVGEVRDGRAVCERDSVLFDEQQLSYPVLAALLRAAVSSGGRLSVLDFGGSLGSSYYQCREFLKVLQEIRWSVVEQEAFVRCGREEFQDDVLRFHFTIGESNAASPANVALLSGVLQYVPDPYSILREIADAQIPSIVIDRLACSAQAADRIAVQFVPASIYKASYPIRIFGRDKVEEALSGRYRVVARFDTTWDGSHAEFCSELEFRSVGYVFELL